MPTYRILASGPFPWSKDPKAPIYDYGSKVENVPISWLLKLPGNDQRLSIDEMADLQKRLVAEGLRDPVIIVVGKKSRTAKLGEGNHRLKIAHRLGYTSLAARVIVGSEYGSEKHNAATIGPDLIPEPNKYFPSDAAPSDVFKSLAGLSV